MGGTVHGGLVRGERLRDARFSVGCEMTTRARRSLACSARATRPRCSSRSIAVVIEPLVRSTRRPISLTDCGPLCNSTSRTPKSEMHMSSDTMLRSAWRTIDRCAFMSTSQT